MRLLITIALLGMAWNGRAGGSDPVELFRQWYQENSVKLIIQQDVAPFTYSLRYQPVELNVLKALSGSEKVSQQDIKSLYEKNEGKIEFAFKVESKRIQDILAHLSGSEQEYNDRLFYLLDYIIQDFTLVTDQGEFKPLRCSFENTYGAAPTIVLHLVFEFDKKSSLKQLAYSDQFFGCGGLIFDLTEIQQLNIPKIK